MGLPKYMTAAVLTGHGGLEKLIVRDNMPVPEPKANEVLINVGACGMNNTDINTRIGWYSKSVDNGTNSTGGLDGPGRFSKEDATWGGAAVVFPLIQGADVAGRIVAVGDDVPTERVGQRVIVDPWLRDPFDPGNRNLAVYLGSERDGGFAQYTTVPAENAFEIKSELTDAELASFPCSYSTGEHMLQRVGLSEGEKILVPGASGGVGSALVQLAKRRGAWVLAVTSKAKMDSIRELGADAVLDRNQKDLEHQIQEILAGGEVDVVADVVGGAGFSMCFNFLCRGGRYVTSYIENGEISPLLAREFSINDIKKAQEEFLAKKHIGNFVILPG